MADNEQLEHDELVRLECLTRAINHAGLTISESIEASTIVDNASKFENFVRNGSSNG